MSKACEVRYIITINALKEGWDCPFAYILASLADKSSAVDVEQILGRVLRQPYVMKHNFPLLNLSYVLTASSKFLDTLDNIVKGLNKAGFSDKDYRVMNDELGVKSDKLEVINYELGFDKAQDDINGNIADDIDITRISALDEDIHNSSLIIHNSDIIQNLEKSAIEQNEAFEKAVAEMEANHLTALPNEIQQLVKTYPIKNIFLEQEAQINLPQFYLKVPKGDHLDAEQKIRLGGLWASKAGNNYRYFMVYERRTVDGAYKLEEFLNIIKDI